MSKEELNKSWSYEFESWNKTFSSIPVELIKSVDNSGEYEMNRLHLFKLDNGNYAVVSECGCSCYEANDACICEYPDLQTALNAFGDKK